MGFDDVAFFAEMVVGDVCNCNATCLLFGSVVVFDVNTASVVFFNGKLSVSYTWGCNVHTESTKADT